MYLDSRNMCSSLYFPTGASVKFQVTQMNITQVIANNTKCFTGNLPSISAAQVSKQKNIFSESRRPIATQVPPSNPVCLASAWHHQKWTMKHLKFQVSLKMQHNTIFYQDMFHCSARTSLPSYSVSGQPDEAKILPFSWIPLRQEMHHQDTAGRQE